jgi:hypothetical protein
MKKKLHQRMQEFGFENVPLDQPGSPTPRRVAERLGDITTALDQAVASGDLGAIANGVAKLGRLRMALDAWAFLQSSQMFLEELRKVNMESPVFGEKDEKAPSRNGRLFRRLADYKVLLVCPEVVVASDEDEAEDSEDFAFRGEGDCAHSVFHGAEQVREISPDDLSEEEAKAVADYLAEWIERGELKAMCLAEIRDWIRQKLEEWDDDDSEDDDD